MKKAIVALFLLFLVFAGVQNVSAIPLTNAVASYNVNETEFNYFTEYKFKADQLGGVFKAAFCVDPAGIDNSIGYELIDVPGSLELVAKMADHYFYGANRFGTQEHYQIAIWETLGIATANAYNNSTTQITIAEVENILNKNWSSYTFQTKIGLAHSPIDGGTGTAGPSQDYLVRVPEPATLVFLGFSMIGVGFAARRKFRNN